MSQQEEFNKKAAKRIRKRVEAAARSPVWGMTAGGIFADLMLTGGAFSLAVAAVGASGLFFQNIRMDSDYIWDNAAGQTIGAKGYVRITLASIEKSLAFRLKMYDLAKSNLEKEKIDLATKMLFKEFEPLIPMIKIIIQRGQKNEPYIFRIQNKNGRRLEIPFTKDGFTSFSAPRTKNPSDTFKL